jgi:hypothetical protein
MARNGDVDMLALLTASTLTTVTFIHDYVQLGFEKINSGTAERYGLSAYTLPEIAVLGRTMVWDEPGYRDALCARIGLRVTKAFIADEAATISFEDSARILISLKQKDYRGPEAFQLTDGKGLVVVQ